MIPVLEAEAHLTTQNQITIPAVVRKVLQLNGGHSRVKFRIRPEDGSVTVVRAEPPAREDEDPSLKPFLNLLAKDIREHPERIEPFPVAVLDRIRTVVQGVDVDLEGPLTGEE